MVVIGKRSQNREFEIYEIGITETDEVKVPGGLEN
jgi:hypothetical protein